MVVIGMVGGVASGKSAVAAALARRGAVVYNADAIGHQVLEEADVRDALVGRWGRRILTADGQVSRPLVAAEVFGDSALAEQNRRFLEKLLHPRIRRRIEHATAALPPDVPAVVIDAPLLLEAGWDSACQAVLFVDAPVETRRQRAQARGWYPAELTRREAAQMPIEQKRARASHVVDNSGSLEDLELAVDRFWRQAVGPPPPATA